MFWLTKILGIIKSAVGVINDNATLILVIVTGVYAYFTYKMAKIMATQIIAVIEVSNIVIGSDLLENKPEQADKNSHFRFILLFDVRNKNSGSGSIDKPTLILKFIKDNFEYRILPKTKERQERKMDGSNGVSYEISEIDLGGTVFLRGGESQKIELEYNLYDFGDYLLNHIKENSGSLEYNIEFSDNLGKYFRLKIDNIKVRREVYRK